MDRHGAGALFAELGTRAQHVAVTEGRGESRIVFA